nr:MAG TPA: cysteine-rich omega-conotoxin-like protein [Caudoviricetes sp.]DAY83661.1 MAG TPA: cysteine-rich omega-conotoxin-like protein [Caudoviricetes sp.]
MLRSISTLRIYFNTVKPCCQHKNKYFFIFLKKF